MTERIEKDKKLVKYHRWYENEYARIINLESIGTNQPKWVSESTSKFSYRFSSIWRHEVMTILKYYVVPRKLEYVCTIFKISHGINQTTYAFLYSSVGKDIHHEFVSICPTFTSADGEYRHRFISVVQFLHEYAKCQSQLELLEKHVLKQIRKKKIQLFSATVGGVVNTHKQVNDSIEKLRLPIKFYTVAWYLSRHLLSVGTLETHITHGYIEAMFSSDDDDFYKKYEKQLYQNIDAILIHLSRFYKEKIQLHSPVEIGQKLIPLTIKQVEDIGDTQHSTWAEIQISQFASNLVINGISPTYPIFGNWFLIADSSPSMYDNTVMHIKLRNSEDVKNIVKNLEHVRKHTYVFDPIKKKEVYLSYNMEGLSQAIEIPMDYAEEEMIMSNHTLCTLVEHMGRTLANQINLRNDSVWTKTDGGLFTDLRWFAKYMFEYLYGLYALNYRLRIIHSDLHLNNATIFAKRFTVNGETGESLVPNPTIMYRVHDQVYCYPTTGRTSCIIDFSRAIIGPGSPLEESFFQTSATSSWSDQHRKIKQTYQRELPEFYQEHKDELQIALLEDYESVFKLFTAIDAFKLSKGMAVLLTEAKSPNELLEFVNKINKLALSYLTLGMLRVFKKQPAINDNWPMHDIITQCFGDYTTDKVTDTNITLVDYFSIDNSLKYDTRDYEKFPPTVKFDYIIKHKIPEHQIGLSHYHEWIESGKLVTEDAKVADVQSAERADKAKRRGSPVAEPVSATEVKKLETKLQSISPEFYYET